MFPSLATYYFNIKPHSEANYFAHSRRIASNIGEPFASQRRDEWQTRYTFSAKEQDEATGYHFPIAIGIGARYYDSDVSVWLSVDPMAFKYPDQTPYSYVGNRPINVIDPKGEDEWELDKKGNVVNRIENKEYDSFHIVEKNDEGNYKRVASSKEYEYGTVEAQRNPKDYKDRELTLFEIDGDDKAKEIFEFFSNNYVEENERPVEWTHAKIGNNKSDNNIVGTTHKKDYTSVGTYLRINNYTLREVNHNHPTGNPIPSGSTVDDYGDIENAKDYKKANPKIKLNVYTREYDYSPYDVYGTKDKRILKGEIPK